MKLLDYGAVFTKVFEHFLGDCDTLSWVRLRKGLAERRPVVGLHLFSLLSAALFEQRRCRQQLLRKLPWQRVLGLFAAIIEVMQVECERYCFPGSRCEQEFNPLNKNIL